MEIQEGQEMQGHQEGKVQAAMSATRDSLDPLEP